MSDQKDRCTLSDEDLVEACDKWIDKLCESGGRAWVLSVPVNFNRDPDMLFIELMKRFKERIGELDFSRNNNITADVDEPYQTVVPTEEFIDKAEEAG